MLISVLFAYLFCTVKQTGKWEPCPQQQKKAVQGVFLSWAFSSSFVFPSRQSKVKSDVKAEMVRSSGVMVSNMASILSEPQFGLRDTIVKSQLVQREDSYTYIQNFRWWSFPRRACFGGGNKFPMAGNASILCAPGFLSHSFCLLLGLQLFY